MIQTNFNTRINFGDRAIQEFLFDHNEKEFEITPTIKTGFSFNPLDKVANDKAINKPHREKIKFSVKEFWTVIQNNISVQNNQVTIIYEQEVEVNPEYLICFKDGISNDVLAKARLIISEYKFDITIPIHEWLQSKIDETLTEDMFYLDTSLKISKVGNRIEFNATQRYAFLRFYELTPKDPSEDKFIGSQVHIIKEGGLTHWVDDSKVKLEKLKYEELVLDILEPKKDPTIKEYDDKSTLTESEKITEVLSAISNYLIPSECGVMNFETIKLLSLYGFPEFKIEMVNFEIEIGCTYIIISLPVLKTRNAQIVFYIYYSIPDNITQTILEIMKVCAIRAALEAAVLGVITCNPPLAVAVFNNQFKTCIQTEALKCINPGIMTIKETDDWK